MLQTSEKTNDQKNENGKDDTSKVEKKENQMEEEPAKEIEFNVRVVCVSLCVLYSWDHFLTSICF